ncbi:hypothetical protein D3C86_2009050 [compost metagenome]
MLALENEESLIGAAFNHTGLLTSAKLMNGAFNGLNLSLALIIHSIDALSGNSVKTKECLVILTTESFS